MDIRVVSDGSSGAIQTLGDAVVEGGSMIADGAALRQSGVGVLLHPTSLPAPFGIGDLGPSAHEWIDLLADHGIGWWQFLPLGPPGIGDAPYQPISAFAGNPLLISPQQLIEDGLIDRRELRFTDELPDAVDYSAVTSFKRNLLERAWRIFATGAAPRLRAEYDQFLNTSAAWLDDFALFIAIKESQGQRSWLDWSCGLRMRDASALAEARTALADAIDRVCVEQFLFFRQLARLREYA
ncbi:MAG: 4-alpha-glucanotransferase, partial [Rhodanobacteraceae bacterium]